MNMKHEIKKDGELVATIETHGQAVVVVHEPQKEIKPVQFADDRDTFVECTPEQREEIIRVARECGRKVFYDIQREDLWPNLYWWCSDDSLSCTSATKDKYPDFHWPPFDEFVARLKGEWVEPTISANQTTYPPITPKPNMEIYAIKGKRNGVEEEYPVGPIPADGFGYVNFLMREVEPTEEPAQPDYAGKWFKHVGGQANHCCFTEGKWYLCIGDIKKDSAFIDDYGDKTGCNPENHIYFDLTNPLDYNPNDVERIIPFDIERVIEEHGVEKIVEAICEKLGLELKKP
jgi:hypothetical protein